MAFLLVYNSSATMVVNLQSTGSSVSEYQSNPAAPPQLNSQTCRNIRLAATLSTGVGKTSQTGWQLGRRASEGRGESQRTDRVFA